MPFVPRDDPRLLQDLVPNDLATWPWPCKRYADGLPVTSRCRASGRRRRPRPRCSPAGSGRARARPRPGSPGCSTSPPASCAWRSARTGRRSCFRAAGSAGGRFPLELYVAARGVDGPRRRRALVRPGRSRAASGSARRPRGGGDDAGRHRHPLAHGLALRRARLAPHLLGRRDDALAGARARGSPACAAAVDAVPRRGGRPARGRGRRRTSSRSRWSRSGRASPAVAPGGEAVAGAVDAAPRELPLVTAAPTRRRRGRARRALAAPARRSTASCPPSRVARRRHPPARLDAPHGRGRDVPRAALAFSLAAAMRGIDVPHFVAVHGVDGVEPGLYRWPDLAHAAAPRRPARRAAPRLLGPGPRPRRRLRRGRRRRPRHARRPRVPRGAARRRARRGPAPPRGLRARRSAPPA